MNSENSRTSESHVLVLKLTDKLDLSKNTQSNDPAVVNNINAKTMISSKCAICGDRNIKIY